MKQKRDWGLLGMLIINPLLIILYENNSIFTNIPVQGTTTSLSQESSSVEEQASSSGPQPTRGISSVANSDSITLPGHKTVGTLYQSPDQQCRYIRPVCQE